MNALAIAALVVIAVLVGYASYLWARVWLHQRHQQQPHAVGIGHPKNVVHRPIAGDGWHLAQITAYRA